MSVTQKAIDAAHAEISKSWRNERWEWDAPKSAVERALRAALSTLPIAGEGKVKALEWNANDERHNAVSIVGRYTIERRNPGYGLFIPAPVAVRLFIDLDAAKAAAQSDYERRILSALTSSPEDGGQEVEAVAWEVRTEDGYPVGVYHFKPNADQVSYYRQQVTPLYTHPSPQSTVDAAAEPEPWGEVRRGSDGNPAIFSTKFNTVKARFTSGNDLDPGTKIYLGTPTTAALAKSPSSDRAASEGWQPIETAPKDGTTIIVAAYCDGSPTVGCGYWPEAGEWFWWHDQEYPLSENEFEARFWMPLPVAPAAEAKGSGQ